MSFIKKTFTAVVYVFAGLFVFAVILGLYGASQKPKLTDTEAHLVACHENVEELILASGHSIEWGVRPPVFEEHSTDPSGSLLIVSSEIVSRGDEGIVEFICSTSRDSEGNSHRKSSFERNEKSEAVRLEIEEAAITAAAAAAENTRAEAEAVEDSARAIAAWNAGAKDRVVQEIRQTCTYEWGTDYEMIRFCMEEQIGAARSLGVL